MTISQQHDVIKKVRSKWSADDNLDEKVNVYKEALHHALEKLSADLYSKDTHFIFELIQNADDNTYPEIEGFVPKLVITLTNTGVIVQNNEVGFSEQNVLSLCNVGNSSKKQLQGYIGEKGIGFKSVFKISDEPTIISNGFQFKFKLDEENKLGFIVPEWLEDIPSNINSQQDQTTIYLPFKRGVKVENIARMLDDISMETLLFLNKLQIIEIDNKVKKTHVRYMCSKQDSRATILITNLKNNKMTCQKFVLSQKIIPKPPNLNDANRPSVTESTVILAFPLDSIKPCDMFAYLPIRSFRLKFIVQADFILPSHREDIHRDRTWNLWLRDCIPSCFVNAIKTFQSDDQIKCNWYGFIPTANDTVDEFMVSPMKAIHGALKKEECILTDSGSWRKPNQVLVSTNVAERDLFSNSDLLTLLGKECIQAS